MRNYRSKKYRAQYAGRSLTNKGKVSSARYISHGKAGTYRQVRRSGATIRDYNDTQSVNMGMVTMSIKGLQSMVRYLRSLGDDIDDALLEGLNNAGEFMVEKTQEVIDEQNFEPLASVTPEWEKNWYGASYPDTILKMNGSLYNSFTYQTFNSSTQYTVQLYSTCDYLAYHIFGVKANGLGRRVPVRDPISPVTKQYRQEIINIVADAVFAVL